jgi:hypothetical protein
VKEAPEGHGTLNWMVTWQSLHGGICIEYSQTELDAVKKVAHLEELGRTPQLYRKWE